MVGARPNFMKIAPIMAEMARYPEMFQQTLVHTGQHYDGNMSDIFFRELNLPEPDIFLGVGSGTQAGETARIMLAFEPVVRERCPHWVVVVGDTDSTLGSALVCAKMGCRLAHVEAGLRSWDRTMPEEINRVLTDSVSDLLFTPSRDANENLTREGIAEEKIHFVGNVMIDTLQCLYEQAQRSSVLDALHLRAKEYLLVTLHRPSNVDREETLRGIMQALTRLAEELPVVFPVHPRTRNSLAQFGLVNQNPGLRILEPLGYLDFVCLIARSRLVLTDSGGVQEETTFLGVPCLTLRENTERPVTVTAGTNKVIGVSPQAIVDQASAVLNAPPMHYRPPELWDGHASRRIVSVLRQLA